MQHFLTAFFLLLGLWVAVPAQAQVSILFVDDTDDAFGNAELFQSALDSAGYSYTVFHAQDSAAAPSDLLMAAYDLVIWHTSSNGVGLWLWNGLDEDNGALKAYLNGGGKLWLVGNDFLFDRYVTPPASFAPGDFPHDYLGLLSYDLQSNGDDGGIGLPLAYPDSAQPIGGLDTLTWIFSTLWWADGVTPRPEAVPIMRMGGEVSGSPYVFTDSICGLWFDSDSFQVLSFFFDLAVANNFDQILGTTTAVVDFFAATDSTTPTAIAPDLGLSVKAYPNPVVSALNLDLELARRQEVAVALYSLDGRHLATVQAATPLAAGRHRLQWTRPAALPAGSYLLVLTVDGQRVSRVLQIRT